ncbi:hypothetical protein BLA29_010729 [Euroglyphus maynei]|uniref:Uncharacterized protein n=1 Tax=Euroglyphus maynei TaxID=6958 RepID=A0A1Y3BA18_EURMA|nr:hypothetical protein BLA29_010729 [Euroglyphus maynei]
MKRYRQSIQYLLKANTQMKKSLAEKTAIQLRINEKDREIEQLERELNELQRDQQQAQLQPQPQQFVRPNDSFMTTFMHHVDQQLDNNHQELGFNVNTVNPGFHHRSNQPVQQLPSTSALHGYNSPGVRSRCSDKSSTIGLAYPIRRDQHKSQQQQQPSRIESMNTSQHSRNMRTTYIQTSQWNRSRTSFHF